MTSLDLFSYCLQLIIPVVLMWLFQHILGKSNANRLNDIDNRLVNIQKQVANLPVQGQIVAIQAQITQLQTRMNGMEKDMETFRQTVDELKKDLVDDQSNL